MRFSARMSLVPLIALLAMPSALVAAEVTFHKDIEPILQANCQTCHRPGGAGPMPLFTYEQVAPFAGLIEYKTGLRDVAGAMPPWYIEKDIGIQDYKDDMSLSEEEIATFSAWARSGTPQGDPADAPAPLVFDDSVKWTLGEPDLIVVMPEVSMKAGVPDFWGSLPPVPTGLTEDRYVKSVEMVEVNDVDMSKVLGVVGGRYIVHHMEVRTAQQTEGSDLQSNVFDAPWPTHEVGRNGDIFNSRAGPILRANSVVYSSSIHLHSTGFDTTAHIEIGFRFHEKGYEPEYQEVPNAIGNGVDISIRPNLDGQTLHAYQALQNPIKLVAFEPHLHAPGERMCIEAIWGPNVETLSCAGYDHNWVRSYVFEDHAAPLLPAGTILHLYGEMNVTPTNLNLTETRNWTGSGNRSVSNMFIDLGRRVNLTEEQFLREMAERRQALNLGPNDHVIGCPLCTAPLVSATRKSDDTETDSAWITIAGILSGMNHFPNDAQKAELLAIANDPESSRALGMIAGLVASLEHEPSAQDRVAMERVLTIGSGRVPPEARVIARGVLEFNHSVSADAKAALDAMLEGT
ncbi:MAG: cytochrome c [Rhodospirillaceae bacterium]|nr:cytochrome c [Rhodospirillaceae bacterium]